MALITSRNSLLTTKITSHIPFLIYSDIKVSQQRWQVGRGDLSQLNDLVPRVRS